MKKLKQCSIDDLHTFLEYDADTGEFCWRERTPDKFPEGRHSAEHQCKVFNSKYAGKIAGGKHCQGYRAICVKFTQIMAHRIAWAMHYGEWPKEYVDHIDGDKTNNRISNLREASSAQNGRNSKVPSHNTSGLKGASYFKRDGRWQSHIKVNGKQIRLGCFDTKEEAHAAYCEAARKYHGEFARTA